MKFIWEKVHFRQTEIKTGASVPKEETGVYSQLTNFFTQSPEKIGNTTLASISNLTSKISVFFFIYKYNTFFPIKTS